MSESSPIPMTSAVLPEAKSVPMGEGHAIVAVVKGDIDLHNSPELRSAILMLLKDKLPTRLVLDLRNVTYMDSSAIAVLVEALQKLRKSGGKVCLTGVQPRVKGLLEIAKLDTIFVIAKDEAEALSK